MKTSLDSGDGVAAGHGLNPRRTSGWLLAMGVAAWVALTLGFAGLRMLLQERPQFVGQPLQHSRAQLLQESPRIQWRKASEDVALIHPGQPYHSDVLFDLAGHRDYRGLRTLVDMAGQFQARHILTNPYPEPLFVLFQSPHPKGMGGSEIQVGDLRLKASIEGIHENGKDALIWSGRLGPNQSIALDVSYQVASIREVHYRVSSSTQDPVAQYRVRIQRSNLEALQFDTGDGTLPGTDGNLSWERRDFLPPATLRASIVEHRSLYESLLQLLEIGPVVCLLFMGTSAAVILARHGLTPAQLLTLVVGYAIYFPLILYLSSRFSFTVALALSLLAPGALLVNYVRLQFGPVMGWIGAPVGLLLYQLFPTLAAFNGWNRGMVLLCLGLVTFWVLIQLQNASLRRNAIGMTAAWLALVLMPSTTRAQIAQAAQAEVVLPANVRLTQQDSPRPPVEALVAFDPATYQIHDRTNYLEVRASLAFEVVQPGTLPLPLFTLPVHLNRRSLEPQSPENLMLILRSNRWALLAGARGRKTLSFEYQVPIESREGRVEAVVPLIHVGSGRIQLTTKRPGMQALTGKRWGQFVNESGIHQDLGVSGEEDLKLRFDAGSAESGADAGVARPLASTQALYGIGIPQARHLTVVASDGSCTHFSELELPTTRSGEFLQRLPPGASLVSASINGVEIPSPTLVSNVCRFQLPHDPARVTPQKLSLRLALPRMELGFLGTLDLELPESDQTVGTLLWMIALPESFEVQMLSSGLETHKGTRDLSRFGDYGRILQNSPGIQLERTLAPPGRIRASLRYRHALAFATESAPKPGQRN